MSRVTPWVLCSLLAACAASEEPPELGQTVQAIGVPQGDFPTWDERVVLTLTNRARNDPAAESAAVCGGGCNAYPASKPLEYHYDLSRAARFQATSLLLAKSGLMHESVCTLVQNLGQIYPSTCDGSPSCACEGGSASCTCSTPSPYCTAAGGLTSTWARIQRFGSSGSGENAAAGNADPVKTFEQWVKSSGHWSNINNASHGRIGVGHHGASGGCYSHFWVQVFGSGGTLSTIPGGAHHPLSGTSTTSFKFWANYYAAAAPQLATVNIDGTCTTMTVERGTTTTGTYLATQALATSGCHHYYFFFKDAAGTAVTYPSVGSFGVGVGSGCANYSATDRPSLGVGCGGCSVDGDCGDGNACTTDTCSDNVCQNTAIAGCCLADAQCADSDLCTTDNCVSNKCQNTAIAGCCTADSDCDDSSVCTTDKCVSNKCQNTAIAGCCSSSAQCDDKDPCTADSCSSNTCQHNTLSGCCKADGDCDDKSACTQDSCVSSACTHSAIVGCCGTDADCADNNPCTTESCLMPQKTCSITTAPGCCSTDVDCKDSDPCTLDRCSTATHKCERTKIPGCIGPDAGGPREGGVGPGAEAGAGGPDGGPSIPRGAGADALIGGCALAPAPATAALPLPLALVLSLARAALLALRRPSDR